MKMITGKFMIKTMSSTNIHVRALCHGYEVVYKDSKSDTNNVIVGIRASRVSLNKYRIGKSTIH